MVIVLKKECEYRMPQIAPKVINTEKKGSIIRNFFHPPVIIEFMKNIPLKRKKINEKEIRCVWVVKSILSISLGYLSRMSNSSANSEPA